MKKWIVAVVSGVVSFAVVLGITHLATRPSARPGEYLSRQYRVAITPPSGWETLEDTMGAVVAFRAPQTDPGATFLENVNLVVESVPAGVDVDRYAQLGLDLLMKISNDVEVLDSSPAALGGIPGRRMELMMQQGQFPLHLVQRCVVIDARAYVFTATALQSDFAACEPTFEQVFASVRFP